MESKKSNELIKLLTSETVEENMNILCAIAVIKKDHIRLDMPGGLKGVLPIANISPWISESECLRSIFEVGRVLPCHVQHVQALNEESKKRHIILSTDPTLLHEHLSHEDLCIGMNIHSSVKSKEEHGYTMDVGILSVRAFLRNAAIGGVDGDLKVGQVIKCIVTDTRSNCLQLSYSPTVVNNAPEKRRFTFRQLIPGQLITVTLQKTSDAGLVVKHKNIVGVVHKYHLKRRWDNPSDYLIGKKLFAVVLYADPNSKVVHFSLNLELFKHGKYSPGYSIGDVLENAIVVEKKPNYVILRTNNKFRAKCMKKEWSSDINAIKINSVFRCLVIGINLMDNIVYVSLKDDNFVVKIKKYSDISVGNIFKAKVTDVKNGGLVVKLNPLITGYIPESYISDNVNAAKHKVGDSINCRVLEIDEVNHRLILTAKKSIVSLEGPVIDSYEAITPQMTVTGTIIKLKPDLIVVKFFNNVTGIVYSQQLRSFGIFDAELKCHVGQTVHCGVKVVDPEKQFLSLIIKNFTFSTSTKIEVGKFYQSCKVVKLMHRAYEVQSDDHLTARLPIYHLSDNRNHCSLLESIIKVGDDLGPVVGYSNSIANVVSRKQSVLNYFKTYEGMLTEFKKGDILPGIISATVHTGYAVELPGDMRGKVKFDDMTEHCRQTFEFYEGMSIMCQIQKAGTNLQGIPLSTRLNTSGSQFCIDWFKEYLMAKRKIEKDLVKSSDQTLAALAKNISKRVKFHVTEKSDNVINGYLNDEFQTPATAPNFEEVEVQVGKSVNAFVVNVNLISQRADLNLLPTNLKRKSASLKMGTESDAKAIVVNSEFAILYLLDGSNRLVYVAIKRHLNDLIDHSSMLTLGEVYPVQIVDNEIQGFIIATILENKLNTNRRGEVQAAESNKKLKTRHEDTTEGKLKTQFRDKAEKNLKRKREDSIEPLAKKKVDVNGAEKKEEKCLDIGNNFDWVNSWETDKMNGDDVDDHNPEEHESGAKKKKLTKKEEGDFIYLKERELADESRLPETEDEFDRLVLASPDSSLVWLQYTAFHLQNLQVDKARAVCKRALSVINFREEQERLNVWVALLNLENTFGSEETFKQTIKDAEKNNDLFKINKCIIKILQKDNKIEQVIEIFSSLIKRYKKDERIWIEYMQFLMESQKFDLARTALTRCESNLTKKQIIDVTRKMGQLEFKFGDAERGRTIFENLIANNPKRMDLWSVFTDLEIKGGYIDQARGLLDRAVSVNGSAKHMKFIFKKYCEFEKTHGDSENLKDVKKRAEAYINSQQTE